jgi:hypothetical protein
MEEEGHLMPGAIEIRALTPQEVEALQVRGMYHCTNADDDCQAQPIYRVSEVMKPGETVLNILGHVCADHVKEWQCDI